MKVLMNIEDAWECTFTPAICQRIPEKHKNIMRQQYSGWAAGHLNDGDKHEKTFEVLIYIFSLSELTKISIVNFEI